MAVSLAQLKSVRAYSTSLPDRERLELVMLLGKRTFSDPGLVLHDTGKVTYIPAELTEFGREKHRTGRQQSEVQLQVAGSALIH
jgi:hypothetical protein